MTSTLGTVAAEVLDVCSSPGVRNGPHRIFLLSPANASGIRAKMLFSHRSQFDLAVRVRDTGAPLGEIYTFISGLYFRGKLAYSRSFLNPPHAVPGIHIITPAAGLIVPSMRVKLDELQRISSAEVDSKNRVYRDPLERDAVCLKAMIEEGTQVVLLGSIATPKYVEPLLEIFGAQLVFPEEFVGRGDMSRGGLLLRSSEENRQLNYIEVAHAVRHGKRPGKLAPRKRLDRDSTEVL